MRILSGILITIFFIISCTVNKENQKASEITDLYISNAMILDGTGVPAYPGNVRITGDQIVEISRDNDPPENVVKSVDAEGRILAPGFIDLHSHGNPKKTPWFSNFLAMGVTTISLGQDGSSPEVRDIRNWETECMSKGLGVNIAMFIGHGTLRDLSNTGVRAIPDSTMMDDMKMLMNENLPYTFGMTTGLEYAPGLYARDDELLQLAKVVRINNRMIMSHMRDEDDDAVIGSIRELIAQGRYCPVHISHLKSVYGKGKARAQEILQVIRQARKEGINITADVYPYTASYTGIGILFPDWSKTDEQFEVAKKTRRKELEQFIINKVNARNGPEATLFGTEPYAGKTLKEVAQENDMPFEKVLIDIIGPNGASAAYFVMNDSLQSAIITDSLLAISSDGSPGSFHPRGHGTFARLIEEYVENRGALTLAEAVRKVTSYPASILGLNDRGLLAEGMKADVILFDPKNVHETATYSDPFQLAEGFDMVVVNGKIAWENDSTGTERSGIFLKPGK